MPSTSVLNGSARRGFLTWAIVLASVVAVSEAALVAGQKMYWLDTRADTLERANLDGSDREILLHGSNAVYLALDVTGRTRCTGPTVRGYSANTIERANLDGSGREAVIADWNSPESIALDVSAGKIYWTAGTRIMRANLDGRRRELVHRTELALDLALDVFADKMYWTTTNYEVGAIWRANLDGSNPEVLFDQLNDHPPDIALDIRAGKMYWAYGSRYSIERSNLDGSGREELIGGTVSPTSIALDLSAP